MLYNSATWHSPSHGMNYHALPCINAFSCMNYDLWNIWVVQVQLPCINLRFKCNYHALIQLYWHSIAPACSVIFYISFGDKTRYRLMVFSLLQCPPFGSLLTLSDRLCTYTTRRWIYTGHLWGKVVMLCACYCVLIGSEVEVYSQFSIGRSKVDDSYRFLTLVVQ